MSKIINLQEKAKALRRSAPHDPCQPLDAEIAELVSRIAGLESKVWDDIDNTILTLGLAARQARQLSRLMRDPALKSEFDRDLSIIEALLQVARDKARSSERR